MRTVYGVECCVWTVLRLNRDDAIESVEDFQLVRRCVGLHEAVLEGRPGTEQGSLNRRLHCEKSGCARLPLKVAGVLRRRNVWERAMGKQERATQAESRNEA